MKETGCYSNMHDVAKCSCDECFDEIWLHILLEECGIVLCVQFEKTWDDPHVF